MIVSIDQLIEIVNVLLEKEENSNRPLPTETFDFYWRVEWSQLIDAGKKPDNFLLGQYSFDFDMLENAHKNDFLYFGNLDYIVSGLLCIHCNFLKLDAQRISSFRTIALQTVESLKDYKGNLIEIGHDHYWFIPEGEMLREWKEPESLRLADINNEYNILMDAYRNGTLQTGYIPLLAHTLDVIHSNIL